MKPGTDESSFLATRLLLIAAWLVIFADSISAASYYVSPAGNDYSAGSLAAPWRTIQKAANVLKPGDTAFIRGGIYREWVQINVSGTLTARITFRPYGSEVAILDGTGLSVPKNEAPLIRLSNRSYVTIQGLELRNVSTTSDQTVPMGILIEGSGAGLEIRNCKVHDIQQNNRVKNNFNANAHGIAAYGSSPTAISGLVIDGCDLYNLHLGASESLALNGNVTGFQVSNNLVHDNNNIGIVFIGYEGTNSTSSLDRARDGVCTGNKVWNIDSAFNPAYGGSFSSGGGDQSAVGIYVDGGTRIVIERNEVWNTDIGVELASEHIGKASDYCTLRDNIIRQNIVTGVSLGGYAKDKGNTDHCTITNNSIVLNDTASTWSGQIQLQFHISNCTIKNNIIQATPSTKQMIVNSTSTGLGTGNAINYNLYYCAKGSASNLEFDLSNKSFSTFAKWQAASGFDKNSIFASPGLASNFDLLAGSAAINKGDPSFVAGTGESDFFGRARAANGTVDIGAAEFGSK